MSLMEEQVAEVQLIQASTSEGEFQWRGSYEDIKAWELLIRGEFIQDGHAPPLAFALQLAHEGIDNDLWLNVDYPQDSSGEVQLTLQGPSVSRNDLDRVKKVIDESRKEAEKDGEEGKEDWTLEVERWAHY